MSPSAPRPRPRRISVVLPVFNEHENVERCLRGLWRALEGVEHEILVVYDFDEDTTLGAIATMNAPPPSLRLVKNELGRGAAKALRAGFLAAGGDVVVTTMADLSDPPELIPALAERVRAGAAVVSGSRYVEGGSQQGGPLLKRTLSRWAGLSLRWISGIGTHDPTSNFRAYAKDFLDSTTIESTSGFQIALELTVKAHLAGRGVDEVPSSWVDRTAGESRFRLWRWLPSYLSWWLRAAAAPLAAWTLLAALAVAWWLRAVGTGRERPLLVAALALSAGAAALALVAARRLRGRNAGLDLLQPALWLHPWAPWLAPPPWPSSLDVGAAALTLAASLGLLALGAGPARLARGARALARRVDERALGLGLVWLLLWAKQLSAPWPVAEPLLDASWEQAVGRALLEGKVWGRDIFFTYGPLGWLFRARYEPELWWLDLVWWQLVYKGLLAGFLCAAFVRIPGVVGRGLFVLALVLPQSFLEVELYQGVLAISAWIALEPRRPAPVTALALALLAVATLVKFTVFVLALPCVLVLCALEARRRSPLAGLTLGAGFLAALLIGWSLCGQPLDAFPSWVRSSWWIASGYAEAMSTTGSLGELVQGAALGGAIALVLLLEAARRPRSPARLALALLLCWGLFVAGKSGYVRHLLNPLIFFATVAVLPLLVPPGAPGPAAGALKAARYACVLLALVGYGLVGSGRLDARRIVLQPLEERIAALQALASPSELEDGLRRESARIRAEHRLPTIRSAVGERSVDLWHTLQAWLFLNDLRWRPRPAFQSYFAYRTELIEANRRFYESERAPDFVLWRSEAIDDRVPNLEDSPAFLVLLRDYVPRLVERGLVLMERRREAPLPPPRRTVVQEREVGLGETVELELSPPELYELRLDLDYSLLGRLGVLLGKAPEIDMVVTLRSGASRPFRIVPDMIREGVLVRPLLFGQNPWLRWFGAIDPPLENELASFRVDVGEALASWYRPTYRMTVTRLDGLEPARSSIFASRATFAGFEPPPDRFSCPKGAELSHQPGVDLIVVPPPSELVFRLGERARVARGAFGLERSAWRQGASDGARFVIALRSADGSERVLLERTLDPRARKEDRAMQRFELALEARPGSELLLRVDPGPAGDDAGDRTYWAEIRVGED